LWVNLVGRDVLDGRWTFQVVEGFDSDYYVAAREEVRALVEGLAGGHRHVHEKAMRQRRLEDRPSFLGPDSAP
jgi:hypothetical protein